MSKKLYLMIGIPGSGKSTYVNNLVKDYGVQVVCADDIRKAFGHVFYGAIEPMIHAWTYTQARALMSRGFDVVIDECNTRPEYIRRWRQAAVEFGYEIIGVHIITDKATCIARRDDGKFPLEVIDRKEAQLRSNLPDIIDELDLYMPVFQDGTDGLYAGSTTEAYYGESMRPEVTD
jgi:predicted kinase